MTWFKTTFILGNAIALMDQISCTDYTYWRYGDGSFSDSLPQNHTLFSTGLLSDSPIHQTNTSQSDQSFFYPLITQTNEIFVLTNNDTSQADFCMRNLSLTKFNQYLNETIATLTLLTNPQYDTDCFEYEWTYPIYYAQDEDEYIIINIAAAIDDIPTFESHLWIINGTSLNIMSHIISPGFLYDSDDQYLPVNVILHNEYIIQRIIWYVIANFNPVVNYTTYNLNGDALWTKSYIHPDTSEYYGYDLQNTKTPIGVGDTIIWYNINSSNPNWDGQCQLMAVNVSNGNVIYNISMPVVYEPQSMYFTAPMIYKHQSHDIILFGTYFVFQYPATITIYALDAQNGAFLGYEKIESYWDSDYQHDSWVYLAANQEENTLMVTNFSFPTTDCLDVHFHLFNIIVNNENVTFDPISDVVHQCIGPNNSQPNGGINHPKYMFMDDNGVSLIGWIGMYGEWWEGPYANIWSMISRDMELLDGGQGVQAKNQYGGYDEVGRYPAIGRNGLIYFAGWHSIVAYDMFVPAPNTGGDKHIWMYFVIGGSVLAVIVIAIGLLIRRKCSTDDEEAERERLIQ